MDTPGPRQLPADVILRALYLLPPNILAYWGRLTCRDAAQRLNQAHQCTMRLSQQLPPSPQAFDLALAKAQQGVSALSFRRQLNLFSTAAASGSQANLELVWAMLRPRVCPELLQSGPLDAAREQMELSDPGVTIATAGHLHLLPWLLAHCPGLVDPVETLAAVAGHCDLAALQGAWGVLRERWGLAVDTAVQKERGMLAGWHQGEDRTAKEVAARMWLKVLDAAAVCKLPEGSAKLEWVMSAGGGCSFVRPESAAAVAAVHSGDLDRVRWLLRRFPWVRVGRGKGDILTAALQHAGLELVEWLVEQNGFSLPRPEDQELCSRLGYAAAASGSVAKLRWLAARGLPLGTEWPMIGALSSGQLEVLRFLREEAGNAVSLATNRCSAAAVQSGSVATAAWLLQQGASMDPANLILALAAGDLDMFVWLVTEAGCTPPPAVLATLVLSWPDTWSADDAKVTAAATVVLHGVGDADVRLGGGAGGPVNGGAGGAVGQQPADEAHWGGGIMLAAFAAAKRGLLPLLRMLLEGREVQPAQHAALLDEAAKGGCEELLLWLVEQLPGGEAGPGTWQCCLHALVNGDLATATCLYGTLGVAWPPNAMGAAVGLGCFPSALQWMAQRGAPAAGPQEAQ